ncbi:MAG: tRNA pseudouridine(38-40) synthase TruA [Defluviitaleaceae bacterium]|nr:tRNA pseudouridine(38-40) synthase TruA [Defluviitaleaceae bacterium]
MGILLTVAYDGTDYCGWQLQDNGISVHHVLNTAIAKVFDCKFSLLGASRTDAGVHALGQQAHLMFETSCVIPPHKLPLVINGRLPQDVRIADARAVADSFHPINDAKSKTYSYKIYNARHRNPLLRRYAAFVPVVLDTDKMAHAARYFVGEHDFAAFCASGSQVRSTVRRIYDINVAKQGEIIEITINGNGFLHNMVRIIAGTLVDVGRGKLAPNDIGDVIASGDRSRAGKTMAPQGLTLMKIFY